MRRILKWLAVILFASGIVFALGPRPDSEQQITFDANALPSDLDSYLADEEAKFSDIRENAAKEIVWNNPFLKTRTEFAVVYIHGFSATKVETSPVSESVAKSLGANLFLTRLTGHGETGDAMGRTRMADWLNDTAEAVAIGSKLGNKVILISASTGGTLSTWAAAQPELSKQIDALVMISPNYAVQGAPTWLLNMPWAETILPAILGRERSFEPVNEAHSKGWTTSYPSKAVFPMGALLNIVQGLDYSTIEQPALFIYSPKDKVVNPERTMEVISQWGGKSDVMPVGDSVDPYSHVIAGDALSANTTQKVTDTILAWINALPRN